MISDKQLRSYEVSIWTLQDSFITVLKPTNLENKEMFQDGKIILKNDGENTLNFTIPMYIMQNGSFIENPLWYNKKNGYLMANLRKIKVIFNKFTDYEEVFEFVITKVTEKHEGYAKICEIECSGLAFNELGKQGYKISLSEEDLFDEVKEAAASDISDITIKNNLNYWVDKVLQGSNWRYSVQMDWSSVDGVIDQEEEGAIPYSKLTPAQRDTLNNNRESLGLRRHDTVYEEAYVSSWAVQNSNVIPRAVVSATEKMRVINENESNRYNLIQKIAEIFEVYTKFKYYYDTNYHIIDREIIFYNNFLNDKNVIDLTYSYDTQNITRELNAEDIVTKMFVKTLDNSASPSGITSIADTEANITKEDYLLNFDYLYSIKSISEEQYDAIHNFEIEVLQLNNEIIPLDTQIIELEEELVNAEIARDNAAVMKDEADKNITYFTEQLKAIYDDKGYTEDKVIDVTSANPALVMISQKNGVYVGHFGSQYSGVVPGSITVYMTRNGSSLQNSINFVQHVENKAVTEIIFASNLNQGYCYATFSYRPALEYINLRNDYIILSNKYQKIYETNNTKIESNCGKKINNTDVGLKDYINNRKAFRQSKYDEKATLISNFENMLGPALREGYWQPEDEYVGYGTQYDETIIPSATSSSSASGNIDFIWDTELLDDEEKNYYEYGVNKTKVYYPCIDLSKLNSNFFESLKNKTFLDNLSFLYKISNNDTKPFILPQGTSCKFTFLRSNEDGTIIPALILLNFYSDTLIIDDATGDSVYQQAKSYTSYITSLSVASLLGTITVNNSTTFSVPSNAWIQYPNKYTIVYPRLRINSNYIKTNEDELFLNFYQSTIAGYIFSDTLAEFQDYYFSLKNEKKYLTIKPELLLANGFGTAKLKINYCISNAALQVYLDAIKIMKENAYPKVSYTINQILSESLLYDTYNRLNQLAHINDAELKFNDTIGYISEVELNLDKPWEDTITIQNYKNKFEDLFSTIVAQTQAMERNGYKLNAAMNAFNANGQLTGIISPDSLLKSTETLHALIRNNANIIAAQAVSEAAKHKAVLASTEVYRVIHGETGLAFTGNNIDKVLLNQDDGLLIAGKSGSQPIFFKVDNSHMGFFKGNPGDYSVPQLYYSNGNLALSGTVYASNGWFGDENGWIIGTGSVDSNGSNIVNKIKNGTSNDINLAVTGMTTGNLGGLLYSANGKAIFTAGTSSKPPMIVLTQNGFSDLTAKDDAVFLFDGSNLYINGHITTSSGLIGGWAIDSNSIYYGAKGNSNNNNDVTLMSSDTFTRTLNSVSRSSLKFAIGANFGVANDGSMYASKGNIGGWTIGSNYIGDAATLNGSVIGMRYTTTNADKVFWAGAAYNGSPSFYVTKGGALYASSATITGEIQATSGFIGTNTTNGWTIDSNTLRHGATNSTSAGAIALSASTFTRSINNTNLSNLQLAIGSKFGVTSDGTLYASGATIAGYTKTADLTVDGDLGIVRMGTKATKISGTVISGTNFSLDENGYIALSSISGSGDIAKLEMNNGWIVLSSANNNSISASSAVKIGPDEINITSNGTFDVSATNFIINSKATDSNIMFQVGDTSGSHIKYTPSGGLVVNGAITATSLSVGSGNNLLTYTSSEGLIVKGTIDALGGTIGGWNITYTGISKSVTSIDGTYNILINSDTYNSQNTTPYNPIFGVYKDNYDWQFFVRSNGELYAKNANLLGGTIGGWDIAGDGIRKGITVGADVYQTRISVPSDNLNLATFGVLKINSSNPNGEWQFYVNGKGDMMANTLYLRNGNIDVAGVLQTLLLNTDNDQEDPTEPAQANGTYGMTITNYSKGNWIKVRKQDGTTDKIPFGNAARLSDARTAGARSVTVNLEDTVSMHGSGNSWTINYTLNSPYMASVSGSESVSMKYVYDDARKGYTEGTFTKISDTLYRKTGSSTYVELSYDAYKKS